MTGAAFHPELLDLPAALAGSKVMLRPYRAGDGAGFFAAVDADREALSKWVGWVDQHRTRDDAEAYVRRMHAKWQERSALIMGIWSKDGRDYFGGIGFHGLDWAVPSLELGYFLRSDAQGRGYASDAVRQIVEFGFRTLAARRIWASCDTGNDPSVRVLERCGFRREATLRPAARTPGACLHGHAR